jgi:hypothetical protein
MCVCVYVCMCVCVCIPPTGKLYFQPAAAYPDLDFGSKTHGPLMVQTQAQAASEVVRDGGRRGTPLSTFVLVGKGACTAGQAGVLWDTEADGFINTIKDRGHGQVWRLPSDAYLNLYLTCT